jgi:hypothetical protein
MADTDVNKPESSGAKEVISFKVPKRKNLRKKQDSSDEEDASTQQNEDEVSYVLSLYSYFPLVS